MARRSRCGVHVRRLARAFGRAARRRTGAARSGRRRLVEQLPVNWRAWTADADAAVRAGYAAGAPVAYIARQVDRTANAVRLRASRLAILHHARRPWRAAEDAAVRAGYAAGAPSARIGRQIGRTAEAVHTRAGALGLVHRMRWTADEDAALRAGRTSGRTDRAIGRELGRSRAAVTHRAALLGLAGPRQAKRAAHPAPAGGARWTAAEDAAVRQGRASGRPARDVARDIGRSHDAVIHRAALLGLAVRRRRGDHF